MTTQELLIVTKVTNGTGKTGTNFKTVEFTNAMIVGGRTVKSNKTSSRNLFDDRQITLADGTVKDVKADPLYKNITVGDLVIGKMKTFETTTFQIEGRDVNRRTFVIFEGEDAVKYANSQLKGNNASVVVEGIVVSSDAEMAFASPITA